VLWAQLVLHHECLCLNPAAVLAEGPGLTHTPHIWQRLLQAHTTRRTLREMGGEEKRGANSGMPQEWLVCEWGMLLGRNASDVTPCCVSMSGVLCTPYDIVAHTALREMAERNPFTARIMQPHAWAEC
jgi:hypothetical protein